MQDTDFNNFDTKSRVLIAPLEWGLGHATRCIPIIKELIANDCVVFIAAEKATGSLLQHEFPDLNILSLPSYNITYTMHKWLLPFAMLLQVPKILRAIYKEHQWLIKAVEKYKIDAVISDNRFGLYHKRARSVFITHQLKIKTGNRLTDEMTQNINYWIIRKYDECWVPDYQGVPNMAGELSHPDKMPASVKYIGCLSRLQQKNIPEKKYDLLVIISGPEPQRSVFEDLIMQQLRSFNGHVLLVQGKPGENNMTQQDNIIIVGHLAASALNDAICSSKIVISRSGYTTVMDMLKLRQKAILVPTPGQTEQEYLAKHLMEQNIFYCVNQEDLLLTDVLTKATAFECIYPTVNMEQYKSVVKDLVVSLKKT